MAFITPLCLTDVSSELLEQLQEYLINIFVLKYKMSVLIKQIQNNAIYTSGQMLLQYKAIEKDSSSLPYKTIEKDSSSLPVVKMILFQ
jgi:hypothetical protein